MKSKYLKNLYIFILLSNFFTVQLWGQFDGIKIMINPGHGGNDSDDRFIAATGFWESEGNLTKGLYLKKLLEARGAEVIISRTQNRTQDDLPLSQISGIANSNQVDYFQSIHSNGFQGTANRTSVFWEQKNNGQPDFPNAKRAAEILADKIFEVDFTTSTRDRGDLTFLGFNLGVLRSLNMPGSLTEGSFHDYIPESYRLLNLDYRKHEAVAILRGMLEYFDLAPLQYGAIAGLAKDKSRIVSYNYAGGKSNDKYKPITNIFASLYQDTTFITSYNGDFNNNGYFVFDSIAPGSYRLIVDDGSYKADTSQINVTANKTNFNEIFLELDLQKAPSVYYTLPDNGSLNHYTYNSLEITFSRPMQTDSTEMAFFISPEIDGSFSWEESSQVMVFNPAIAFMPQTIYQVTLSTKTQNNANINLQEEYEFSFTTAEDHIYPKVNKTIPFQNDSITIFENIELFFDQNMLREKVEQAFKIVPDTEGSFAWIDDKHLVFKPDSLLKNTFYTITVSDSALNRFSVGLEQDFQFIFKTYSRNSLNIIDWFPKQNDDFISTKTSFFFHFDGILDVDTVISNLLLQDENQNNIELDSYKLEERNGTSVLRFDSKDELNRTKKYSLTIFPGIKDVDKLLYNDTLSFTFETETDKYESGVMIDDFENESGWQDPELGTFSQKIDLTNSSFSMSFLENISETKSAMISYQFTEDSLGICQVSRQEPYQLTFADSSVFGIWVYGDYSFNLLELWYDIGGQENRVLMIDTLDFSGWKLLKFPVNVFDSANISLHSIVVKQGMESYPSGIIYIDDLQYDVVTDLQKEENITQVTEFKLHQNYPNPFNPKTVISYQLKEKSDVNLAIYNLLGQKVQTLVSAKQSAGLYKVAWNAARISSGVYFYKLQTKNGFTQVRKMIVLK